MICIYTIGLIVIYSILWEYYILQVYVKDWKIECKQWYTQMADVMNIFSTESIMREIILQLWIKKKAL